MKLRLAYYAPCAPFAFLVAIAFAHIAPALFTGRVYANLDYGAEAIPAAATLNGRIPFVGAPSWNPDIFGGAPAEVLPTMARYPFNLGAYMLPPETAVPFFVALHLAIAAIAAFFFVRRVAAVGDVAAVFGAAVFAFGGSMWIRGMHVQNLAVFAWMPAILLAAWEVCAARDARTRRRAAAALAAFSGLALLVGGGFQPLLYCAMTGVLVMGDGLAHREDGVRVARRLRDALPWLAGAAAIALLIGMPGLLPTLGALRGAARGSLSLWQTGAFSLTPPSFVRLFIPEMLLDPGAWTEPAYLERWVYFGLLTLPLAAAGARDVRGRAMLLWTITAMIFALGLLGPLHYLAYFAVPGYDHFRAAGRWVVPAGLVLGCLSARGLDALIGDTRARRIALVATAVSAAGVGVMAVRALLKAGASSGALESLPFGVSEELGILRFAIHGLLAVVWLTTALLVAAKSPARLRTVLRLAPLVLAIDALSLAWQAPHMQDPKGLAPPAAFVAAAREAGGARLFHDDAAGPRPLNNGVRWGYRNARGYSQGVSRDLAGLLDAASETTLLPGETATKGPRHTAMPDHVTPSLFRLLGVGVYVSEDVSVGHVWMKREPLIRAEGLAAWVPYETPFAAALVTSAVIEPDEESARTRTLEVDPWVSAVVAADVGLPAPTEKDSDPSRLHGTVELTRGPDGGVIEATVGANQESLLVLGESFHPRWQATVDGKPAAIVKADTIWQGVRVPPGSHSVKFTCRPAVAWWMWAGMLAGLAIAGAMRWARIGRG